MIKEGHLPQLSWFHVRIHGWHLCLPWGGWTPMIQLWPVTPAAADINIQFYIEIV